ncbi:MAG: YggS family pyridoxal phosphate-dependent enzyme [Chloroflexi bacterium]|nr:YggS family pyridoxal phosphate-dependent enzyme [Chloroflexota bacterium]
MDSSASGDTQRLRELLEHNIGAVRARIAGAAARAGRNPDDVTVVAVTKTVDISRIKLAYELGLRDFGENRIQEAESKLPFLEIRAAWHLVGHLQTNKARDAVRLFDIIHSIDSLRIAEAVDRHASALGKRMPILLEANIAGEETKSGIAPEGLPAQVEGIVGLAHVEVQGLMTIAPIGPRPEAARPYFRRLRELRDSLELRFPGIAWRHLSMGMTDDFEVAVEEGATLVRIGRAIFGERPQ